MAGLDDILRPKSQEEIEDLEKRGFRKNSGKWKFNINISELIKRYEGYENEKGELIEDDTEDFRTRIIALLEKKIEDLNIFLDKKEVTIFENIIKDFRRLGKNPDADDLDQVMVKLYNWADDNDIWVESF
jgi:hypothetical protein